ncbi:MAG: HlyD family efflux transporter periplasmic adaptor subunit [Bryobacteraceae bacterium]|nr:HlyD family efflux transporter periplasmic adaptor subunit [Bryobacteraceae bacterium]
MKRLRVALIVVAVLALAAFALVRAGVFDRTDPNVVKLSGNIELTEVEVAFKIPGRIAELNVREGDFIRAGHILARIDPEQLEQQRSRDRASVTSSQTQLSQARAALDYQRSALNNEISLRRAELKAAEIRLRELETGSRPQEIQQARARVTEIQAQLDQARADWDRAQTLFKNDDISRQQYDQFRARHETTQANLRHAQQALALVEEGPRKEVVENQLAQVERARAALRLSQSAALDLKRREAEVATREAEIARATAQLGISESQVQDTIARAPVDGVILVKPADIGEVVAAGASIVTIGAIDRPWLRGYITERDLGRVKIGDKVRVISDSYPGKAYWGKISFISSQAEFTPKTIQTHEERVKLVYRIKVDIDNPQRELKSNMPVDGEILLGQ